MKVNDENKRIRIQDPDPLVRGMDPQPVRADPYPDPHQNVMDPQHCLKGKKTPLMIDLKTDSNSWTLEREENSFDDRLERRQQQLDP